MDYISKRVEVCNSLDDFILKLKQGKIVKLNDDTHNYYYSTLTLSDTIKLLYCSKHWDDDIPSLREQKFGGILNCENNKLFLEENMCYALLNLFTLNRICEDEFYSNSLKVIMKYGFDDKIALLNIIMKQVDEILCRYDSDRRCSLLEDKSLIKKDLSLDYNKKYDNIQKLAMGINNYIYTLFERYDDFHKDELLSHVVGYLDEGLDYLKGVDTSEMRKYKKVFFTAEDENEKCLKLYEQYTDVKGNMDEFIKQEIKDVLEDKDSVQINDFRIYKPTYDNNKDKVWIDNKIRGRGVLYSDINTIKYKEKEIFNREKVIKRLSSSEYQAGINSLIKFVSDNFDRYNNKSLDLDNVNAGNLIYSKNGHFGVVIGEHEVYLDNGIQADINNINICFKDEELDEGLKQMKNVISREYNDELQKVITKNQKEQEEKER